MAIHYEPDYGPSYYHLAKLEAVVRGDLVRAKSLVRQGLAKLKPVESEVKFLSCVLLGGLLSGEKDYAGAMEQFEEARKIGGDRVYEHVNLGRLYELMGEREKALAEWDGVRKRFGLASPTGLEAYFALRKLRSKIALDYNNFLPTGTDADYQVLLSRLARRKATDAVRMPVAVVRLLNELKIPVRMIETDLDGDGKVEIVVVEARQVWDPDVRGYYLASPVLYIFTPKGGTLGFQNLSFDHFLDAALVDFNTDGQKEIVFTAFTNPNVLNVVVMTRKDRRYLSTFAQPVECVTGACGVLVDDLDGDGTVEVLTVSGVDLWVTVWRWNEGGTFSDASAGFGEFYRDYVKRYEKLTPEELRQWPIVGVHLREARRILSRTPVTGSIREGTGE